jgi:TldD protein
MFELAREMVSQAIGMGAQFAEARVVEQARQLVRGAIGSASINETGTHGFGIRVLVDGHWGFASAPLSEESQARSVVGEAIALARGMPKRSRQVRLAEARTIKDSYETPCVQDPFDMPLSEKIECVRSTTQAMSSASAEVVRSTASLDFRRETSHLVTSEGTEIRQTLTGSGLIMGVAVECHGQLFQHNYVWSSGEFRTGGFEQIARQKPMELAQRLVSEALQTVDAPLCESQVTTVILDSTMLPPLIHETIGHAVELDRALGDELDNFGPTYLRVPLLGNLRLGSEHVTIMADATRPGGAATFGYDHEGTPAQKFPVVEKGVFTSYLHGRESALAVDQESNGTSRASEIGRASCRERV